MCSELVGLTESSLDMKERTISPADAETMCVTGAKCEGIGNVCLRVSYVQKNMAAKWVHNLSGIQIAAGLDVTPRRAANDYAAHSLVNASETPGMNKTLGRL